MLKKSLAFLAIILVLSPIGNTYAAVTLEENTNILLGNVLAAESVDFNADLDITIKDSQLAHPINLHTNMNGVSGEAGQSDLNLNFWATDERGEFRESSLSVITQADKLYFSSQNNDWYWVELEGLSSLESETDPAEYSELLNELFQQGIIDYDLEGVEFINRKMTARYTYSVNNDRLVDSLLQAGAISTEQATELRAILQKKLNISGEFWVDTMQMLPVKLTGQVTYTEASDKIVTVEASVYFKSFNQPLDIKAPKNAQSIDNYQADSQMNALLATATAVADDTDGDSMSTETELKVWHTNPLSPDSDGDHYSDETEIVNGYDPNGPGRLDSDRDGLSDYQELTIYKTNRYSSDSDRDGYLDGIEIKYGYNPNGPGR